MHVIGVSECTPEGGRPWCTSFHSESRPPPSRPWCHTSAVGVSRTLWTCASWSRSACCPRERNRNCLGLRLDEALVLCLVRKYTSIIIYSSHHVHWNSRALTSANLEGYSFSSLVFRLLRPIFGAPYVAGWVHHMNICIVWLKSIHVHLSPESSCGLVAYTCAMVYFLYGTYSYLLTGRDSGLMTYITRLGSLRGIHWSKRF